MNFATSRFSLDLQESQSQVSVPALYGDTARAWLISLSDGGVPYTIGPNVMALLSIRRPSGGLFESYCSIDQIQNRIVYHFNESDVTKETAKELGIHTCQITLSDLDGNTLGTAAFTMIVHGKQVDVNIEFTDDAEARLQAITEAENVRQSNENIRQAQEAARQAAFAEYLLTVPRIVEIKLLASAWEGEEDPYTQVVSIEGVTENTKVDLQPSAEQLAIFHDKDLTFVTENDGGVVTVFAIGDKPTQDYTIQATLKEVVV